MTLLSTVKFLVEDFFKFSEYPNFTWCRNFAAGNRIPKGPSLLILRQQKDWVGGVRKITIFVDEFSTIYADVGWGGGSEKVQKCSDVI